MVLQSYCLLITFSEVFFVNTVHRNQKIIINFFTECKK